MYTFIVRKQFSNNKFSLIHCLGITAVLLSLLAIFVVFSLAERTDAAPAYPLKIGANKRILVDQNNQPFLINGDTPWSLIVGLTKTEADQYLENRRQKGFNAIIANLIEHYFGGPANIYGQQPFTTPGDFSTPNENYFAHADWVISKAAEKGLLVILTPAYLGYGCGEQGWCQEMISNGVDNCRNYGRYLGNRYKGFANIIWMEGSDAEAESAIEELRAMTEGIKEVDSRHLHTAHCYRQQSGLDCYNEPWLDINSTYSDCSMTARKTLADYNRNRLMPFFYVEGTYENEGASERCLRSQAYSSILGGSTGHFFGNNPIWFLGSGWQQAMESVGSKSMSYVGVLFNSRAWFELVPDYNHTVVTSGYGDINNTDYLAAGRTNNGNTVIAYMPTARKITVDMTKVSGTQVKAWWFNPGKGLATLIRTYPANGTKDFTPSDSRDWVLVLDNAALNFPAPGTGTIDNQPPLRPTNLRITN